MPNLKVEYATHLKCNPDIFAVLSQGSDYFETVQVKEFMGFEDYKKLTKIRIRNYVTILRMLTKVDVNLYQEIKTKLYQIQTLCSYLDLGFEKIFERLHENQQIHDMDSKPYKIGEAPPASGATSKKSSRKASKNVEE